MKTEDEIFKELFKSIDTSPGAVFDPRKITVELCKMTAKVLYEAQIELERQTAAKVLHEAQIALERFKNGITK
jgi:hypothetical protein